MGRPCIVIDIVRSSFSCQLHRPSCRKRGHFSNHMSNRNWRKRIAFQILRNFEILSPNGSQMTCNQSITAKRYTLNMVEFPADVDGVANPSLTCNDSLNLEQTTHPNITGWPNVLDSPANSSSHCKMAVAFTDQMTHLCGDSYIVKRAWSVVNLCNSQTKRDTQTIVVIDEEPPVFEISDTLFFSLSGGCVDSLFLPPADLVYECSGYDFILSTPWGDFTENGVWIFN